MKIPENLWFSNCRIAYRPQDLKPTRITLFQASEIIEGHELSEKKAEPTWGWNQYASGSVDIHVVPGDHFTMMNQPNVLVLAEKLKVCLEQA